MPKCPYRAVLVAPSVFVGLSLLGAACRRESPTPEKTVAVIGGQSITVTDFERAMQRRGGDVPGVFSDPQNRRALLDEMIRSELLVAKAREAGYFSDPEIRYAINRLVVSRYEKDLIDRATNRLDVTDAEVAQYYGAHASEFRTPERIRVAMIQVGLSPKTSEEKRNELSAKTETIRQEALAADASGPHFGLLAAKYSDDQATRYKGGDVGWMGQGATRYRWADSVVSAVFALSKTGEVSQVLSDERGFYVFKLMEKQAGHSIPFDTVKENVRRMIDIRKRTTLVDEVCTEARKTHPVHVDTNALNTVQVPVAPAANRLRAGPPGVPED